MAAWQHLVLEDGQDDKPGMGRATALLDMTKCFEQVRLWHVWRWRCHWVFPKALLRIILVVFNFQRRVGLWESVSQPVTTHAAIIAGSVFSCEPHSRDGDHGGSEHDGGLAGERAGLPRVERRGRRGRQVGGLGLERLVQSGTDFSDQSAQHYGRLARVHPGRRRVRSGSGEAAQNAIRTADQNQEEDAQGSVLQVVWRGHEQDRQGEAHCLVAFTA